MAYKDTGSVWVLSNSVSPEKKCDPVIRSGGENLLRLARGNPSQFSSEDSFSVVAPVCSFPVIPGGCSMIPCAFFLGGTGFGFGLSWACLTT